MDRPATQEQLAADPSPWVRADLAIEAATAEPVLRFLADDEHTHVRQCLARNPAIPLDLLIRLVQTTKVGPVLLPRVAIATDDEVRALAASPSARVRALAAQRTALPADVFQRLVADPDVRVARAIAPHLALAPDQLRHLAATHGPGIFRRLATNPNCDPDLLDLMARTATARRTYVEIARHPNTRGDTLVRCLADDLAHRWAVQHPNFPA